MIQIKPILWVMLSFLTVSSNMAEAIGVNWGTMASHTLHPQTIVGLCKDNGFDKVKLFDSDPWTVKYFANTGIEVMLAIPNNMLHHMSKDIDNARNWVKHNVTVHSGKVKIKLVAVGNEPFLKSYNGTNLKTTFPAMQNIQKALNQAGHSDIKVTVPLNADVYESANGKPSGATFRNDTRKEMIEIVEFLKSNKAPFVVNIYPFLSLYGNPNFPVDFAFCDGRGNPISDKNGASYTNVFDGNYDTLLWSLIKDGAPDMEIIVGEIGWPTDGDIMANVTLAKRFYDGFFEKMAGSNKGTPLRPGKAPEVYLFGLIDENQKSIAPGNFERHWGIFRYDGKAKFPMDFTGKGKDKMPVSAKGVESLPLEWCVIDKDKVGVKNLSSIRTQIAYACSLSDCTALGYGSSCNHLDSYDNISYGYNMYFQMQDQSVPACDFGGTAKLVTKNASTDDCLFPVQIVQSDGRRIEVGVVITLVATMILMILL